jgi:hypothetical protein
MDKIEQEQELIDSTLNEAWDHVDSGSKFPGMGYEEGVIAMHKWLTSKDEPNPMDE